MALSEAKSIEITERQHLIELGMSVGLLMALEAIKDASEDIPRVPGMGLARSVVEATEAHQRVRLMQANLRLAYATWGPLDGFTVKCDGDGILSLEPGDAEPTGPGG